MYMCVYDRHVFSYRLRVQALSRARQEAQHRHGPIQLPVHAARPLIIVMMIITTLH